MRKVTNTALLLLVLLVWAAPAAAAVGDLVWETSTGRPGVTTGHFSRLVDGDLVVVGERVEDHEHFLNVARFSPDGALRWSRDYGDRAATDAAPVGGALLVTGMVDYQPAILRLDADGTELGARVYRDDWDYGALWGVCPAGDGGAVVTGYVVSFDGKSVPAEPLDFGAARAGGDKSGGRARLLVMKLGPTGNVVWKRDVPGLGDHVGWKIARTAAGDFVVSGFADGHPVTGRDLSAVCVGADGDLLWTRRVGGVGDDNGGDLLALDDGRLVLCGSFAEGGPHDVDAGLAVLAADGALLSLSTVDLGAPSRALGLAAAAAGGVLLSGWTGPAWADPATVGFLAEVDEEGGLVQKKRLGSGGFHVLAGVGGDGDGGWLAGGSGDDGLWALRVSVHGEAAPVGGGLRHAGPGAAPECAPAPDGSDGTLLTLEFSLDSAEVAALRAAGAVLRLSVWDADAELPVTLNGSALPAVQPADGCGRVFHYAEVTSTLRTGVNVLRMDCTADDVVAGDLWLLPGAAEGAVEATATADRGAVRVEVRKDGEPFDHVLVDLARNGQVLRTGQPLGGVWTTALTVGGRFDWTVREQLTGGEVLAAGELVIDLDNAAPSVVAAAASPDLVDNGGSAHVLFEVEANDADGVAAVAVDLSQLGGGWTELTPSGNVWRLDHLVVGSTPIGYYRLPVRVTDALGASGVATVVLTVMGSTPDDSDVITACGFTLRASSATETVPGVWSLAGNVRLTHASGLALFLDAGGAVTVTLDPARIVAEGTTTLYADLGDLGRAALFSGEFAVEADGALSVDGAAEYLLDEVAGFLVDPSVMTLDLEYGAEPGLRVSARAVFDAVDGVPGNGLPAAAAELFLGADGAVSGSLVSDVPGEPLAWGLRAGTLSITSAVWSGRTVTVSDATFDFLPGTFDFGSKTSVTVPTLVVTPEGIDADAVVVDDFTFTYGGFEFSVVRAGFDAAGFAAEHAEVLFPLPTGDVYAAVEGLAIADGRLTLTGGAIAVPPLKVGSYDLGGVSAALGWADGQGYLDASGRLSIPAFAVVDVSFALDSRCEYLLREFCMAAEFSGRGVPIGSTGFLLTDIGGCIADPACSNDWIITFSAGVSSADRIVPPDLSVIAADVSMEIVPSPFRLSAQGDVDLVGFPLGGAGFDLYADRFAGWGQVQMPPALPMLHAEAATAIRWSPRFSFSGDADGTFSIPAKQLFFLDEDLQLAAFHAEIDDRGLRGVFHVPDPDNYFVEVSASFDWTGEASFDYDLDWPFLLLDTRDASRTGVARVVREPSDPTVDGTAWRRLDSSTWVRADAAKAEAPAFRDTVDTVDVPADASPFIVTLHELPEGEGGLTVRLLDPSGTVVDSLYCAEHDGFVRGRTADWHIYRVAAPAAGAWRVIVDAIDAGEDYELRITWVNEPPVVALSAPASGVAGTTEDVYGVTWSLDDPEGDALRVTLQAVAADPAAADPGPWLLAAGLSDSVRAFDWRPVDMADGDYRLVLTAEDAYHPAVSDTSVGVVTLVNATAPLAVTGLRTRVGPNSVRLDWNAPADADIRSYRLLWREQGTAQEHVFDVGRVTGHLLGGLENGVPYEFLVAAYDVAGNVGPAEALLTAAPDPLGDVAPPVTPAELAASGDPATGSVLLTWMPVADAVAYRVHYDRDAVAPWAGADAAEGASPVLQSRVGSLTLTGLDPGVAHYAAVSAVDAAGNESALSAPVTLPLSGALDADADGLPDDWEIRYFDTLDHDGGSDPDGDGLDNRQELEESRTDPGRADTDGDRVSDGVDPAPLSAADLDGDGLPGDWGRLYGADDPAADLDGDGLTNLAEFAAGTAPRDPDTDGDQLSDGLEAELGTDAVLPDTDGGGVWDGFELFAGGDPLDPSDDTAASTGADDAPTPLKTGLGVPQPNPFNARLTVPFTIARPGRVTVELYDLRGRRVRSLLDEPRPAGIAAVHWDGRDAEGRDAASGVYLLRFLADDVETYRKVMLVK